MNSNLIRSLSLVAGFLILLLANSCSGNLTSSSDLQQVPPSGILTTPSTSEDEANGDDGAQLKKDIQNLKPNKTTRLDEHQFYKPEYIKDPDRAMSYWIDFSKLADNQAMSTKHKMLSKSYRRAAPIKLTFDFPFYGHPLRNIIVATGGFLYVGDHIHHWLAATQNISPLMANFDLSTSDSSDIHYYDNGTSLTVQWQDVQMKDNKPPGNFSFQVTLHKNGDIVFVYKSLPVPINEIPETEHPVKVGLSDAFLIDKVAFFIRRKTIFDYHRLNLKDVPEISNKTAVYLKALPTCNQFETCDACSKSPSNLECIWCPAVARCSNGFDRRRQEWLSNSCDKLPASDCSIKLAATQTASSQQMSANLLTSADGSLSPKLQSADRQQQEYSRAGKESKSSGGASFLSFLMFLSLTSGVAFWVFYAYKNPHTPSGQTLIRYRPSNWRWHGSSDNTYTAASIHM